MILPRPFLRVFKGMSQKPEFELCRLKADTLNRKDNEAETEEGDRQRDKSSRTKIEEELVGEIRVRDRGVNWGRKWKSRQRGKKENRTCERQRNTGGSQIEKKKRDLNQSVNPSCLVRQTSKYFCNKTQQPKEHQPHLTTKPITTSTMASGMMGKQLPRMCGKDLQRTATEHVSPVLPHGHPENLTPPKPRPASRILVGSTSCPCRTGTAPQKLAIKKLQKPMIKGMKEFIGEIIFTDLFHQRQVLSNIYLKGTANLKFTLEIKKPNQILGSCKFLAMHLGEMIPKIEILNLSIFVFYLAKLNPFFDSFHKGIWLKALLVEMWNIQLDDADHIIDNLNLNEQLMMSDEELQEKFSKEHSIDNNTKLTNISDLTNLGSKEITNRAMAIGKVEPNLSMTTVNFSLFFYFSFSIVYDFISLSHNILDPMAPGSQIGKTITEISLLATRLKSRIYLELTSFICIHHERTSFSCYQVKYQVTKQPFEQPSCVVSRVVFHLCYNAKITLHRGGSYHITRGGSYHLTRGGIHIIKRGGRYHYVLGKDGMVCVIAKNPLTQITHPAPSALLVYSLKKIQFTQLNLFFNQPHWQLLAASFTAKKLAQLPAVDIQKVPGSYFSLMHSHCAYCTLTVPEHLHMQTCGVWMAAWPENSACQLQEFVIFFAVLCSFLTYKTLNGEEFLQVKYLISSLTKRYSFPLERLHKLFEQCGILKLVTLDSKLSNPLDLNLHTTTGHHQIQKSPHTLNKIYMYTCMQAHAV
ncbi:hypothetical protein VP01_1659g2 [Puccinia sorghi]|uniref:Uncharacterized protein n=1 Tax=Puccinia sorghi TaxID=27349 RepID=A0A0L6VGA8_9BASI|nr:hypothetical protein VP01_1659g2 [Puccinia sorghi]